MEMWKTASRNIFLFWENKKKDGAGALLKFKIKERRKT